MGFSSIITDSPPWARSLVEHLHEALASYRRRGEYEKATLCEQLIGQVADIYAMGGRG